MLTKFKKNGVRVIVRPDLACAVYPDGLTFDMLDQVTEPLAAELPMGMRYFFAKYDSNDLKNAYNTLRNLYEMTTPTVPLRQNPTGALLSLSDKTVERCEAILQKYAGERATDVPFTLWLTGGTTETIAQVTTLAREILPELHLCYQGPMATIATLPTGFDVIQAEVGKIEDFALELPVDKVTIVAEFGEKTDLSAQVTRLLDAGYQVCAIPAAGVPDAVACAAYDSLSRTLTRRYRTDTKRGFVPFALDGSVAGRWYQDDTMVTWDAQTLPGAYFGYGWQMHMAACGLSMDVMRTLVECALALAER